MALDQQRQPIIHARDWVHYPELGTDRVINLTPYPIHYYHSTGRLYVYPRSSYIATANEPPTPHNRPEWGVSIRRQSYVGVQGLPPSETLDYFQVKIVSSTIKNQFRDDDSYVVPDTGPSGIVRSDNGFINVCRGFIV